MLGWRMMNDGHAAGHADEGGDEYLYSVLQTGKPAEIFKQLVFAGLQHKLKDSSPLAALPKPQPQETGPFQAPES